MGAFRMTVAAAAIAATIAAVLAGAAVVRAAEADPAAPLEVRVGLLAYEDFSRNLDFYERTLRDLLRSSPKKLQIKLALGTYGDFVAWLDRGAIDVALVTPGVMAAGLEPGSGSRLQRPYQYLAALAIPPARTPWASAARRRPGSHDAYQSVCLVRHDSPLRSLDDLQRALAEGRGRVLFVDPLSVSGRIAPQYALLQRGVRLPPDTVVFTHSHSNSLRRLLAAEGPTEDAAFVWDDAAADLPDAGQKFRRIEFAELDALPIPQDAVAARAGFGHADLIRAALVAWRPDNFRFAPDWAERYAAVAAWSRACGVTAESDRGQQVTLDELGGILLHDARSLPRPPRLAVVLSGGGAKCAYQVGAVAAVEQELARLRHAHPDVNLDIALVVGTSGGAINALPIALGITASDEGQADFQQVWQRLDQREIVRPSRAVRANIGLWFALLQVVLVARWARRGAAGDRARLLRRMAFGLLALSAVEILLGYLPITPWHSLGANHWVHHAWLWCTFGIHWSAWCLLAVGIALWAAVRLRPQWQDRIAAARRWARPAVWAGLLGLPAVQLITVLFFEQTLSGGAGIERALAQHFPGLIDRHLQRAGQSPLELDAAQTDAARLAAVSRQVIERGLLRRDLVLTGSCLSQPGAELPGDLYFFAPADAARPAPPLGPRGVALAAHPELLLDVVMGSGSIYPVFPSRALADFPSPGQQVELVDGGFAHNSPIEAAVLWGATHILLIQASPAERREPHNFLENAAGAFSHLYAQAQRVDVQSKEQAVVFTLAPQPPHLCVLDFADNLIAEAVAKGRREARGETAGGGGAAGFRKELGQPQFWQVKPGP